MKICVYTACFGDHDRPAEVEGGFGPGIEAHCFTDDPSFTSQSWIVHQRRPRFLQSRMDAKWYKLNSTHLFPEHDYTVYLDSSIVMRKPLDLVPSLLNRLSEGHGFVFFEHPEGQRSLEDEALFSSTFEKYRGEPLIEQVLHYRSAGLPRDVRLYAGGCILREHGAHRVRKLEQAWFNECVHWSTQDQVSLPYVLWLHEIEPAVIPGTIYDNALFYRVWSGPSR